MVAALLITIGFLFAYDMVKYRKKKLLSKRREEMLKESVRRFYEDKREAKLNALLLAAEQRKAKEDAKDRKNLNKMYQAEDDIGYITDRISQKQAYIDYLKTERDACTYGNRYYHSWNNKLMAAEKEIHTLKTQRNKAVFARDEALNSLDGRF